MAITIYKTQTLDSWHRPIYLDLRGYIHVDTNNLSVEGKATPSICRVSSDGEPSYPIEYKIAKVPSPKTLRKGSFVHSFLIEYLDNHDRYKSSYFWNPPSQSSARRRMEFDHSLIFIYKGKLYDFEQSVGCSCKNVYYSAGIYVNGKKKDIRIIRKLLRGGK